MPTYLRSRSTKSGQRFDVQYRRGGQGYPVEHAGTFKTEREANIRLRLIENWLAAGKNPRHELAVLIQPPANSQRFSALAAAWLAGAVDLRETTLVNYRSHLNRVNEVFGDRVAADITPQDVVDWIGAMIAEELSPGTVASYVRLLRMILDGLDENPARHRSVKLPRLVKAVRDPPDADAYLELLAAVNARSRGTVALMEQTGMRITEALHVEERDIDRPGLRVLARVTKSGLPRWVPLQPWYAQVVEPTPTYTRSKCAYDMRKVAPHIHPHLLRHRRATLWHQSGVYATELAARLGHANTSESLDTYSHVRPIREADTSRVLEVLGQ